MPLDQLQMQFVESMMVVLTLRMRIWERNNHLLKVKIIVGMRSLVFLHQ